MARKPAPAEAPSTAPTVRVQIPPHAEVEAVGPYRRGHVYEVSAAEAAHLVRVKGLEPVDAHAQED